MSKLEELEEELYGKDEKGGALRRTGKRVFFQGTIPRLQTWWKEAEKPPEGQGIFSDKKVFKLFLWGAAIIGAVGIALFLFIYLGTRGREVEIVIHGRERIEAGEEVRIPVVIRNISGTVLREVEMAAIFPKDIFILEGGIERPAPQRLTKSIPDIRPGEEERIEIVARIFGRELEEKKLEISVLYRPENLRARFSAKAFFAFVISRVPLAISWETPETLASGQDVEFKVNYSSNARAEFKDLSLRLDYPPGFTFVSAAPGPSTGDTIWSIGTLEPDRQGSIAVRGKISGAGAEVKTFLGGLGKFDQLTKEWKPYIESSRETKIALAPLSIEAVLGEVRQRTIIPGERMSFVLRYKNNTELVMKNVSVRTFLEGAVLELSSLSVEDGGVLSGGNGTILWGPGSTEKLREMEPGEEGDLRFSVATKERPPVKSTGDQNLTVRLRSVIEAATVPREFAGTRAGSEDNLELKVRSKVLFSGKAFYRSSPLLTAGPLPPRVGIKTTYAAVLDVRNFTNDLENVEVKASLPPNVKWENVVSENARISFDEQASEVKWRIGKIQAGIGVLSPALTGAFLVSILPFEADLGKTLTLLRELRLTGLDTFTGENIEVTFESLTTELREDPTTTSKDWAVVR